MRRAINSKLGQWVEVVFKSADCKKLCTTVFIGYILKRKDRRIMITFTREGALFTTDMKPLATSPIAPPEWGANMWDVRDDADKIGHYALLYDARYKTIISDSYEGTLNREIRDYQKYLDLFTKLQKKEPWK